MIDLFAGSGSTLIAAEQLNRVAYVAELDPDNVDIIIRRWQDFTGEQATLVDDGRSYSDLGTERAKAPGKAKARAA